MSAEYSLLDQLGVTVPALASPSASAPSTSSVGQHPSGLSECRVWTTTVRPPAATQEVACIIENNKKNKEENKRAGGSQHADPTGEVLIGRQNGEKVEFVVMNSKVPSVAAINKQMMEEKHRSSRNNEVAMRPSEEAMPLVVADQQREIKRRQVLSELQRCNREQADRSKAEQIREAQRRAERETATLYSIQQEEEESRLKAHAQKVSSQIALREDYERVMEAKQRRRQEDAEEREKMLCFSDQPIFLRRSDDGGASSARMRAKEFQEENRRLAEEVAARRREDKEHDRQLAREADRIAYQDMQNAKLREQQEKDKVREAFEGYVTAAAAAKHKAMQQNSSSSIVGGGSSPIFLLSSSDESRLAAAARRQQQQQEDREYNRQLAEKKRERERAERANERAFFAAQVQQTVAAQRRDLIRDHDKKQQRQAEIWTANEKARVAKAATAKQERIIRSASAGASAPIICGSACVGSNAEREQQQHALRRRQAFEDIASEVARRKEQRLEDARRAQDLDRHILEHALRSAQAAEKAKRTQQSAKAAEFAKALEEQMEAKQHRQREERAALQFRKSAAPQQVALYRCPVTQQLLPASAFDFKSVH